MRADTDFDIVIAAAREEADRMRAAVSGREGSAPVRMSATQFHSLASLIEQLADRCDANAPACWLDDDAGAVRSWVPLRHLEAARQQVAQCEVDVLQARAQLEAREADNIRLTSLAFGLQPSC